MWSTDLRSRNSRPPAREGDEDHPVVEIHVGHQLGALRRQHTDHLEGNSVDLEGAAEAIGVGEQDLLQLGADHGHAAPRALVGSVVVAATPDRVIANPPDLRASGGDDGGPGAVGRLDAGGLEDLAGGAERARHARADPVEVVDGELDASTRAPPPRLRGGVLALDDGPAIPGLPDAEVEKLGEADAKGQEQDHGGGAPDQADQGEGMASPGGAKLRHSVAHQRGRASAGGGRRSVPSHAPCAMRPSRRRITRSAQEATSSLWVTTTRVRPSR